MKVGGVGLCLTPLVTGGMSNRYIGGWLGFPKANRAGRGQSLARSSIFRSSGSLCKIKNITRRWPTSRIERLYRQAARPRKLRGIFGFELKNLANAEIVSIAHSLWGPLAAYGAHMAFGRARSARELVRLRSTHLRAAVQGQPTNTNFLRILVQHWCKIGEIR